MGLMYEEMCIKLAGYITKSGGDIEIITGIKKLDSNDPSEDALGNLARASLAGLTHAVVNTGLNENYEQFSRRMIVVFTALICVDIFREALTPRLHNGELTDK